MKKGLEKGRPPRPFIHASCCLRWYETGLVGMRDAVIRESRAVWTESLEGCKSEAWIRWNSRTRQNDPDGRHGWWKHLQARVYAANSGAGRPDWSGPMGGVGSRGSVQLVCGAKPYCQAGRRSRRRGREEQDRQGQIAILQLHLLVFSCANSLPAPPGTTAICHESPVTEAVLLMSTGNQLRNIDMERSYMLANQHWDRGSRGRRNPDALGDAVRTGSHLEPVQGPGPRMPPVLPNLA